MQFINKLKNILTEAGEILLSADDIYNKITEKSGTANFVTEYDISVQKFLYERLSHLIPGVGFIGEENVENYQVNFNDNACFIIDPIDGTTNFIHGYQHCAISVGLYRDGSIYAGAVYNPYLKELFYAERGKGACLGNNTIHVSNRNLSESLICFGTSPYKRELADETFALIKKLYLKSRDIRRSGCAALDLCYVASGRCDLFFESSLSPWDYAAGSIIIEEAGGVISSLKKTPLHFHSPSSVIAANPSAYRDFYSSTDL